jgi:G3E family GTPase
VKASRIPVWLLTGYLGSGKTTLLATWLRDPALADAALVINEIGEVGLDDRLLAASVDSASLVANACVCCTGLPGLEEALADLFWDRLYRRRPPFGSVVIETTGLADPGPVIAAFERVPLLRERYELAGVMATASATAGLALIEAHDEARAQIANAGAIVVTKVDQADGAPLAEALHAMNAIAGIATSRCGSLAWTDVRALMAARRVPEAAAPHGQHHHHAAAQWMPMAQPMSRAALQERVGALRDDTLLRLKGVVRLDDGVLHAVQWSPGDARASVTPFDGEPPPLGLTRIAQS